MPDTYSIPWPAAVLIAGAMSTAIGVLWRRLIAKDDAHTTEMRELIEKHNTEQRGLTNRYHTLVVALHQSIEFQSPEEGEEDADGGA